MAREVLDWTENPLFALYFAVENHPGDRDAAVWALDPWWLNRKLRKGIQGPMLSDWREAKTYLPELEAAFDGKKLTPSLPAAIEPPHVDRRLAAQASRFVIFGTTRDFMRTKAARTGRPKDKHVRKIRIPRDKIQAIEANLADCGITASSIFPDLEGLCREICWKWKDH